MPTEPVQAAPQAVEQPGPPGRSSVREIIEGGLEKFLPSCHSEAAIVLDKALRDAVFPGGKRLRPRLTLLGAALFGAYDERVLRAACAVEFVHTSSLIIDDLPCMDDADLRRGNPSLHRAYGESVALLAGIALLNQAYALFGQNPALIHEATQCIGVAGMIGGQAIDLGVAPGDDLLEERDCKTSAMMRLALTAGALAAGIPVEQVEPLAECGQLLGRAFQICDDLLDAGRAHHDTGKPPDQDNRHNRPSHASRFDPAHSHARVLEIMAHVRQTLLESYGATAPVQELLGFIGKLAASVGAA